MDTAAEVGVVAGRTVVSLISEDLATSPCWRAGLGAARSREPRLVLAGRPPRRALLVGDRDAVAAVARRSDERLSRRRLTLTRLACDERRGRGRPQMTRLALIGYGAMGRLVEQLAPRHGFDVALRFTGARPPRGPARRRPAARHRGGDRLLVAAAVPDTVERLAPLGIAMVVGTTGWTEQLQRVRDTVAALAAPASSTAPTSRSACRSSIASWRRRRGCSPPTPTTIPGSTRSTTAASGTRRPAP